MSDVEDETLAVAKTGDEAGAPAKKVKKIIRKKKRPARAQIDPADMKSEPPPQTGTTFNIWYDFSSPAFCLFASPGGNTLQVWLN